MVTGRKVKRADALKSARKTIHDAEADGKTECCGVVVKRCPDDIESGHIEHETLTECGEDLDCADECWKSWSFCPYCGKSFEVSGKFLPEVCTS